MTSTTHPLVTIAIPTYNRADGFLREALTSAVSQTYQNIEIIVSDNCSTDHTDKLVQGCSDQRIRYFKQPRNIGANNNFQFCVTQSRGDFLLMLFDDDLVDSDFVETCMNAAQGQTDIGIIRTGTRVIGADGATLVERPNRAQGLSMTEFFLAWFSQATALYLCSTLFNTRRLREIGGFHSKHNLYQDVVAEFLLAAQFGRLDVCEVKASFRTHSGNMGSSAKISYWADEGLYLLDLMCNLVPEDKATIRREGMRVFCRKNYIYTAKLGPPLRHLKTYLVVYRKFGYCYSPLSFIYSRFIRSRVRAIKRRLAGAVISAPRP